ncbi:MAG: MATE family efflux transporter [Saprospiraceae bacterium]
MNKEILRLAIPNIISNISVPLLSTVDTALMGRLSEVHIGAVGIGAMIFNFVYWNFGFLRMGTTGITAQAYGQQNKQAVVNTLGRAILVVLVVAAGVLLLQYPLGQVSFSLMNISAEQQDLVAEYFYIRVWAAPATLGLYALMGWFFGMQNAIYPLILTVAINAINIVLSFFLVHQMGMDVAGVAYGTLAAQYFGLVLGLFLLWWKYRDLFQYYQRAAILKWEELRQFLSLNADIFLRTFCLTFAFGFFYSQSASEGELVLAANVILLQFLNWMSYGVDGFAYASESLVGKYAGAKNASKTRQAVKFSFVWGMALATIFSALYGLFGTQLLYIYTNQSDVITATLPFLFWMFLFPILSTPCYLWDGIFIGLTATKAMRNSMVLAFIAYLAAWYFLRDFGNHGLWAALLIFMVFRGVFQGGLYWKKGVELH